MALEAFTKLAASIAFNKLANQKKLHSKIWKTVAKNAPLFAVSGGLAGLALENPHAFKTLIDEPAAGFNALLSPITKHLPDSILERNPLKSGTSEAFHNAQMLDADAAFKSVTDELEALKGKDLELNVYSPGLEDIDSLGFPRNKNKLLDFIGVEGSATIPGDNGDMIWNISESHQPVNTQLLLNDIESLPRDFSRGARRGLAALGGIGLGTSAGLTIADKMLQKRQPVAYSLHQNVVAPIRDRINAIRGIE